MTNPNDPTALPIDPTACSVIVNARKSMATRLELKALMPDERIDELLPKIEAAFARAFELVDEIESDLTEYETCSPVYRLNHSAPDEWISIGSESAGIHFIRVYDESLRCTQATGGAFDPGFRGDRSLPLVARFEWSEKRDVVRRINSGITLGFGAIGKGYAVDRIAEYLSRTLPGIPFVINFGGSSLYFSGETFGTPLGRVGWGWDRDDESEITGAELVLKRAGARAIGVSGTVERGAHIEGSGRQPNVSGDTERPTERIPPGSALSVFASGASALDCDAFTTALFVLEWEAGYSKKSAFGTVEACAFMGNDRIPRWDREFSEIWAAPFSETKE